MLWHETASLVLLVTNIDKACNEGIYIAHLDLPGTIFPSNMVPCDSMLIIYCSTKLFILCASDNLFLYCLQPTVTRHEMEQHHNLHQMAVAPNITSTAPGHIPQSTPCVNCHLQCSSNVNLLTGKQLKLAQTKIQYNYIYIYYSQYIR